VAPRLPKREGLQDRLLRMALACAATSTSMTVLRFLVGVVALAPLTRTAGLVSEPKMMKAAPTLSAIAVAARTLKSREPMLPAWQMAPASVEIQLSYMERKSRTGPVGDVVELRISGLVRSRSLTVVAVILQTTVAI